LLGVERRGGAEERAGNKQSATVKTIQEHGFYAL